MALSPLLHAVDKDTVGPDVVLRTIGSREPPAKMIIQIAVKGTGTVQVQARITRDAPWQDIGPAHSASALMHIEAVQFLRAVSSGMTAGANVSAWAAWGW
jgi:hypothetical protein